MEQETQQPVNGQAALFAKLARVTAAVDRVAKDGKNTQQNYKYTTDAAAVEAVRGHLAAEKIALLPSVVSVEREAAYTTNSGSTMYLTRVYVRFMFVCGDTGATHECSWAGEGTDTGDKGIYKAYTGALKTFLLKTFLIPAGDDPEQEQRTRGDQQQAQAQQTVNQAYRQPNRRQQLVDDVIARYSALVQLDPTRKVPTREQLGAYNEQGLIDLIDRTEAAIEAKQVEIAKRQEAA